MGTIWNQNDYTFKNPLDLRHKHSGMVQIMSVPATAEFEYRKAALDAAINYATFGSRAVVDVITNAEVFYKFLHNERTGVDDCDPA